MAVVIPRNSTIPCHKAEPFTTTDDNQTTITIPVYEGERTQCSGNNLLGTFELTGLPPAKRGAAKIEISFDLDANGILLVTAMDKATNNQNKIMISNHKGRLSDAQIATMISDAEKNKEEDLKIRKRVEAKNELEAYAFQLGNAIDDLKNMSVTEKDMMTTAVKHTITWLDENDGSADIAQIQMRRKDLESLCAPIIGRQYSRE